MNKERVNQERVNQERVNQERVNQERVNQERVNQETEDQSSDEDGAQASSHPPLFQGVPELPDRLKTMPASAEALAANFVETDTENPYAKFMDGSEHNVDKNIRYIPPPTNIIHSGMRSMMQAQHYAIPDYYMMSLEERMSHLTQYINRYATLRTMYPNMDIPKIRNSLDPTYLRLTYINYAGLIEQTDANSSIDMYRFGTVVYLLVLETFVTKIVGVQIIGMSSKIYKSRFMAYYEAAMYELCEVGGGSFTTGWHPMLKILFYGVLQTMVFIVLKMLHNWVGPVASSMLDVLITKFVGTDANILGKNGAADDANDDNDGGGAADIPDVPPATQMPQFGGVDISSILTNITSMFGNGGGNTSAADPSKQPAGAAAGPNPKKMGPRHGRR
jgi:hypothetical protein